MSDITKKFSLLNDFSVLDDNSDITSSYCFQDASEIIINGVYIFIPTGTVLKVFINNGYISFKMINHHDTASCTFEIEYKDLNDFHLLIRGE